MSRYSTTFAKLKQNNQGAFVPFVMLGDPSLETSRQIINTLIEAGADALELGIPFSDPIADGPTIQAAAIRALAGGANAERCFELIKQVRDDHPEIPMGLLVYSNLVAGPGIETFYQRAADAGVDSVLVADVPAVEAAPFIAAAEKAGVEPIFIAPPNASEETLAEVAKLSKGYTYLLSRAGVTGAETEAQMPADSLIAALKKHQAAPALLGFGISNPEHVKTALASGADGVIIGSAIVKRIEQHREDGEALCRELSDYVKSIKQACALPQDETAAQASSNKANGGFLDKLSRLFRS